MKRMRVQRETSHLRAGDGTAGRVVSLIQLSLDAQTGRRRRVTDQFHDRFKGAERTPSPILSNVTKEAVLNLVPLARPGREVRDMNAQPQVIGQALHFHLPRSTSIAVAAARVGG